MTYVSVVGEGFSRPLRHGELIATDLLVNPATYAGGTFPPLRVAGVFGVRADIICPYCGSQMLIVCVGEGLCSSRWRARRYGYGGSSGTPTPTILIINLAVSGADFLRSP